MIVQWQAARAVARMWWPAVLGALVIGSISNGMDLLSLQFSIKIMVTGGVLLAAVTLDAALRKGKQAAR